MNMDRLRITHQNVQSLTVREKQHLFLRTVGIDNEVLNLVETHSSPQLEFAIRKMYPHLEMFFNHGPKMAPKHGGRSMPRKEYTKGTLTIFAPNLIKNAAHTIIVPGMLSYIDFELEGHEYRFVSVYAPSENEGKKTYEFFDTLFDQEILDPLKFVIISGDWNSARTEIDHHNYTDWECYKPKTRQMINDGILEHSLYDPYRHLNLIQNATAESNGWTYTKGNKRSRLDYFLVSPNLTKFVTSAYFSDIQLSGLDHRPIHITLNFLTGSNGSSYFRCPNQILKDDTFKTVLQTHVCNIIHSNTTGPYNDYLKIQDNPLTCKPMALVERIIREVGHITKEYSTRKRIAEKKDKEALIKSIELVKKELDSKATEDPSGEKELAYLQDCLLYTSPSPRDKRQSRMPSSA